MSRTIGNQNFVDDSYKAPDITFILKTPQSDTHPNDLYNVLFDVPKCK